MSQPRDSQIAFDLHEQLSEEQKIFVKTRKLEGTHKIKHWVDLLDRVAHLDEVLDEKTAKSWPFQVYFFGLMGVASFVACIYFYNTGVTKESNGLLHWSLIVGAALGLIFASMRISAHNTEVERINMPNNFRLYFMPLLHILSGEAGENARLRLNLDFSYVFKPEYKVTGPIPKAEYFELPWLDLKTTFADGTEVEISITDLVRKIVQSRRNPRGKLKTKTKYKVVHKALVALALPKARYKLKAGATIGCEDKGDYYLFKLKGRQEQRDLSVYTNVNALLGMVSQVYTTVEPI